ncbi:unnamed protein product [Effrenium voratum]|nr:unnamed protein product [Effrenium voratum]
MRPEVTLGSFARKHHSLATVQRGSRHFCGESKGKRPLRPKEELLRDSTHHDVPVRRKAVKDLGKYRDDNAAIAALAKALGDEDVAVQLAAQGAMSKVADIGDERTVKATLERVSSTCEWTRIAALSTLADITGKHGHATRGTSLDLEVDAAVRKCLKDEDWGVRRAAMDTMAARAAPNCAETVEAAKQLLEEGTLRCEDKGDQHAIELEKSACDDRSWIVRKAATDSLAVTASLNDLASLRKLARMLEDFDPLPRMAAIYGLAELCGVGHRKAIKLAEARLEHRDPGTRQALALMSVCGLRIGLRRCSCHEKCTRPSL